MPLFQKGQLRSNHTKLDEQPWPFQFNSCLVCKQNIWSDLHVQDEGIISYCIPQMSFVGLFCFLSGIDEKYLGFFSHIKWILKYTFEV